MGRWRFLLLLLLVIMVVGGGLLFLRQRRRAAALGPPTALCPGPDFYGYRCESGTAYAYIDATNDTLLYELDGTIQLTLPFPFTFYGTTYTEVRASSNGNLQFTTANPAYNNTCLSDNPAPGMGDMVAPYWDDFDLRSFGALETEVVGEAPERIFVIEWDNVPRFESSEAATFAVQLFESNQDIVFLYPQVSLLSGGNGRSATIGLQSEVQGLTLEMGCDVPVVSDASQLRFVHPHDPNGDVGLSAPALAAMTETGLQPAKGETAALLQALNRRGDVALTDAHLDWLQHDPPVTAVWNRADLTGNGVAELFILKHSTRPNPHLSQLLVMTADETGVWQLSLDQILSTRSEAIPRPDIVYTGDLTADGLNDILLLDRDQGRLLALTAVYGSLELISLPQRCQGQLTVRPADSAERVDIIRDGCETDGRLRTYWDGQQFITAP